MSAKQDWIRDQKVNIILQLATRKHRDLGEVPVVMDLAKNDADRKILELIFSRQLMAYPYAAPPDVPAERLQSLRYAFEVTMKDPEFLADALQQKLDIEPVGSEELAAVLHSVYATPADVIARARLAITEGMKKTINK